MHTRSGHGRRPRLALALLVLAIAVPGLGSASITSSANAFVDDFETTPGPLKSSLSSDPWEVKSGVWKIVEQPALEAKPSANVNRILVQESKGITPDEPLAFVRAKSFQQVTMQVTAAFMDPISLLGDLAPGGSVGIVFRAPLADGLADKDNLYLFSAVVTGVAPGFPTGKAFVLFKRMARGYYLLSSQVASTWADFSKPHDYKVVAGAGRIQAFVDGRKVIDHTDIPSPDQPTMQDDFPGLPFDQGAVGLRTSGTRAWFDNFSVVGNDAYEGRANAVDVYTNYGFNGSGPQAQIRRGVAVQLTHDKEQLDASLFDTKFVTADKAFDRAIVRPVINPAGGQPAVGTYLGTTAADGVVTSRARLVGFQSVFSDPDRGVSVTVSADSVETVATASCTGTDSKMRFVNGMVSVLVKSPSPFVPDAVYTSPLNLEYPPNSVILQRSGLFSVTVHSRSASTTPHRIEAAAVRVTLPDGGQLVIPSQTVPVVPNGKTPEITSQMPPLDFIFGQVVAGRYCS